MTIKWVVSDPLVMNGEPFCYGTRLTVRNILELRSAGYTLARMLKDHPELRRMGVAAAYEYAGRNRDRYAEFFEADGSLAGPGYSRGRGGRPAEPVPDPGRRDQALGRRAAYRGRRAPSRISIAPSHSLHDPARALCPSTFHTRRWPHGTSDRRLHPRPHRRRRARRHRGGDLPGRASPRASSMPGASRPAAPSRSPATAGPRLRTSSGCCSRSCSCSCIFGLIRAAFSRGRGWGHGLGPPRLRLRLRPRLGQGRRLRRARPASRGARSAIGGWPTCTAASTRRATVAGPARAPRRARPGAPRRADPSSPSARRRPSSRWPPSVIAGTGVRRAGTPLE